MELTGLVELPPETRENTKAEPILEEKEPDEEDIFTVEKVLRNKELIGFQEIQVRGRAKNIEYNKGLFDALLGGGFTSFLLTDDQGNSLEVHLDNEVTNIPQDRDVIVTGKFEKLFGDFIEYFSATNITW